MRFGWKHDTSSAPSSHSAIPSGTVSGRSATRRREPSVSDRAVTPGLSYVSTTYSVSSGPSARPFE